MTDNPSKVGNFVSADRQLNVPFDRLISNAQNYTRSNPIKKRDALEAGLEILPAQKSSRVDRNDLAVERFNDWVESRDDRTRHAEVLRIRKNASRNLHPEVRTRFSVVVSIRIDTVISCSTMTLAA